ncbi:MAG: V-type ATP synthase subunit D [Oscillospiraceae bacterium]|nr:V-type ATP synthase subunit D [Oscillospiraceae bacterium]
MSVINVSPTRMELTKIKKRLAVATKGHKLLKDKRDELMRRFLDTVRETKDLRERVEVKIAEANRSFALASSITQREAIATALMLPKQKVSLNISAKNVMGVNIPVFDIEEKTRSKDDSLSYGYAFTSGDLDNSISILSETFSDLLLLAEKEKMIQMLAVEIEKTRRRVNALEYVMIPNYQDTIRYITMKLGENERGNITRLMKVKDMMVEKQIEARKRQNEALSG